MMTSSFIDEFATAGNYKSPHGTTLNAKCWQTEAPLRMLLNNLDSEVAEDPDNLVVYGGTGQAARNRKALEGIINGLLALEPDETLLVQSGKPVGVIRTHLEAPRVLIANSNLVPNWANWEEFRKLQEKGLTMYGQMTAGSWIYIGSQGILQGTYETFAECANKHFGGSLAGQLVVSGGLGGMGGAQPLAATMNDAAFLGVDVSAERIQKRLETRYIDKMTDSYAEAIQWVQQAKARRKPLSVGLIGNIGPVLERMLKEDVIPDVLTDQTSAHDPLNGYVPPDVDPALIDSDPTEYTRLSKEAMARHVHAMLEMQKRGSITFDYGNNLRGFAVEGGEKDAFNIPGFVPEYIRPLFCEGKGPFRWAALSGDPEDIYATDEALIEAFPEDKSLHRWLRQAREKIAFQGLPCRICWLGLGERDKAGLIFNDLVASGKVKAPIAIGRDHLDTGSVASPYRETEGMKDGSDAISDWPLLNLMSNCASGATWISFHHGGGVGIGFSQHAGMVVVADGTPECAKRLERVLFNDPATGVIRHADAGYETAQDYARRFNLRWES